MRDRGEPSAVRLLSQDEVRRIDLAAEAAGRSGAALMAAAGGGVARAALARWSERRGAAVVLAGPGKNGGDGYVAAKALAAAGRETRLLALGDPERLSGDAAAAMRDWRAGGGVIEPLTAPAEDEPGLDSGRTAFVLDALFGVGLSRPLEGAAAEWARRLRRGGAPPVLAVDLPSGVLADSGRVWGEAFAATVTATFVAPKRGHFLDRGARLCGELTVVDIGAPAAATATALAASTDPVWEIGPALWRRSLAKTDPTAHKYDHGHALALSGGLGASGAARLAARAALRMGAGLVTVGAPEDALAECAAQLTSVMLRRVDRVEGLDELLADPRINAAIIGPGHAAHVGGLERTARFTAALLAGEGYVSGRRAAVLDADALSCWGDQPQTLFQALAPGRAALTPHMGEFARLFPDLAQALAAPPDALGQGRIEAARAAAARAGAVIVLKGADTVVAAPDGRAGVHAALRERAAPQLATAGSGDVLAGMICGLAARGWDLFEAASAGVWLHVEAARRLGPGMIAEDLIEALPQAMRGR